MRNASKVWDETKTAPLRLKQRLADAGRSMGWLAEEVTKKRYKISRPTIWLVINKQYQPGEYERLKGLINEVLAENSISKDGVWLPWAGAERRMWQSNARNSYRWRGGARNVCGAKPKYNIRTLNPKSEIQNPKSQKEGEMNYTKSYIDDEVLSHFGLESDPFYDIIDFTDVWVSPRLKVIERRVYDTIQRHGIMAIIGDIGAGKTTFLRYVLSKLLKEKNIKIIYPDRMDRKQLVGSALTQAVITQLGGQRIPRSGVERDAIAKRLLEENVRMGTNPVLVLDEAHDLREEAYIALKRLWDSGMIFKLLSIILVGQGGTDSKNISYELKDRLENNPFIREFAERCYVIDMGNLNGSMAQYLEFRFKKGGGDVKKVFSDKALHVLAKRADVPQLANNIAIRAMNQAYKDGKFQVAPEHIMQA